MIPNLQRRSVDNLVQWLTYELDNARSERAPLEADWVRYQQIYRAAVDSEERNFPFRGAAKLVVPIAATDIDTTHAGLMGALFGAPNLWSTEALKPETVELSAKIEEFLEWAQEAELGMYSTVSDWIMELCKLGTGILKQRYVRETKRMFEWRETPGGILQHLVKRIAQDHPEVSRVALADFYVPSTTPDLVSAPWCSERLQLTWTQLEARVRAGIYRNDALTKMAAHWRQTQPTSIYGNYQRAQEALDNFLPGLRDRFEVFEFWCDYDIDVTGEPVSIVTTIHLPTYTPLRIDYNPFFHQEKPYSVARFLRQEGRFYGIGLAEMMATIQEEVSTMHCQRIDNQTIRNTTLLKGRRGSGIKQDEPIWPGRIFLMDNPAEDLVPMQMGYPAESTMAEEELAVTYARQRSSVSDWQRGGSGAPALSYSTATTTIEMLKQGKLRLDQVLREIQAALSETGQRVMELYQQFNQGQKPYVVFGPKDGQIIQTFLQLPLDTIRTSVAVKVTATNAQLNKETKIRTDQIIFGLVMQFYQQLFQGMGMVVNPQIPMPLRVLAGQMVQGGLLLARQILDAYGQKNVDQIIPDLNQLHALTGQLSAITGPQPGGAPMGPGPQGPPGVPALPAGFGRPPAAVIPAAASSSGFGNNV